MRSLRSVTYWLSCCQRVARRRISFSRAMVLATRSLFCIRIIIKLESNRPIWMSLESYLCCSVRRQIDVFDVFFIFDVNLADPACSFASSVAAVTAALAAAVDPHHW